MRPITAILVLAFAPLVVPGSLPSSKNLRPPWSWIFLAMPGRRPPQRRGWEPTDCGRERPSQGWESRRMARLSPRAAETRGGSSVQITPFTRVRAASASGIRPQANKSAACLRSGVPETYDFAFSPDSKLLAVGSTNGMELWDIPAGKPAVQLEGSTGSFTCVGFSADGKLLHAVNLKEAGQQGERNLEACRWDTASGKLLKTWPERIINKAEVPPGQLVQVSLRISPDGGKLLKGFFKASPPDPKGAAPAEKTGTNELRVYDAESGKELAAFTGLMADTSVPVFSADGKHFAIGGGPASYVGNLIGEPSIVKFAEPTDVVALAPDGKWLASLRSNQVSVWDTATTKKIHTFVSLDRPFYPWVPVPLATNGQILAVGEGETVRLWDVAKGVEVLPCQGHDAPVQQVSFAGDGKTVFSSDGQGFLRWILPPARLSASRKRIWQPSRAARAAGCLPMAVSGFRGPLAGPRRATILLTPSAIRNLAP